MVIWPFMRLSKGLHCACRNSYGIEIWSKANNIPFEKFDFAFFVIESLLGKYDIFEPDLIS